MDYHQNRPYFDASTKDLVDELMTRGSSVIVLMARPKPSAQGDHELQVFKQISGGEVEVKGLVAHIQDYIRLNDLLVTLGKADEQFDNDDPEPGDTI